MKPLQNKVALVAGATRGAGRAIAIKLGEAGATVYVTGRTTREQLSPMERKETIEDTAEKVTEAGGKGIPVQVDHTEEHQVQNLFEQIKQEQGKLHILINDIWGGDPLTEWGKTVGEHDLTNGLQIQKQAVHAHLITSHYGVPLMKKTEGGLVIEITDGTNYEYRGNLYYSLAKISNIHIAQAMAADLKEYGITTVALTPGFLRSEAMLDHFGVTEENWKEATKIDEHFIASETPFYIGEAVKHLVMDDDVQRFNGEALSTWGLSEVYNFTDIDGSQPHWGKYFEENVKF